MKKFYEAVVKNENGKLVRITSEYASKEAFISDLRHNGYRGANKNSVRVADNQNRNPLETTLNIG